MIKIAYPAPAGAERPFVEKEVPFVENKSMKHYLGDLGVVALRMRCRMVSNAVEGTLRLSHVPKDGEVVRLIKTR